MKFYPEGMCKELNKKFETLEEIYDAIEKKEIIEARVLLCDREHNLHVDLGAVSGIIPRNEGAIGISEGYIRDIALISKVNKPVCFIITDVRQDSMGNKTAILSRKKVQEMCKSEFLDTLLQGDVINARITHLEKFGVFIDIGAGINALIPIDMLSVSRINHPSERVQEGQLIRTVLRKKEPEKLTFSLKELLGTWEENASEFSCGETVTGVVRSIEEYGIFIELAPNLAGLAEPQNNLFVGQQVAVFIKSIIPDKMKIKLVIVETFDEQQLPLPLTYYETKEHIDNWNYSPQNCIKKIETEF